MSKIVNNENLLQFGQEFLENLDERYLVENILYADLKALRDTGKLIKGKKYRITDYVATVGSTQQYSEAMSANHPFDIIVTALDTGHLYEECSAAIHAGDTYFANQNLSAWRIWYTLDNDSSVYDWADTTNGKGVIYRMIDENANDIGYDFKGILFARHPVAPLEGYEAALSDINGMYLGLQYTGDNTPAGISVDLTQTKWFYTFSRLNEGWDDVTDASLRKGLNAVYNVSIPTIMRSNARFLSNNVFMNGEFVISKLTELGGEDISEPHAMHIDAMGDTSQNTFFGYVGSIQSMSQLRHNIFVGDTRHNRFATDFEGNTIVAPEDISFNDLWMLTTVIRAKAFSYNNGGGLFSDSILHATDWITSNTFSTRFKDNKITAGTEIAGNVFAANFYNNTITATGKVDNNDFGDTCYSNTFTITGEFQANTINGYCYENTVTSGNFINNELSYFGQNTINTTSAVNSNVFGPYFENNTLGGRLTSNRFASGQTRYCSLTDIMGSTFGGILEYVTVPAVSGKRFIHCDVKGGLRGTASVPLTLDNDAFFLASASGVTRRVTIEGSANGKITATWKDDNGLITGVYKLPTDATWTTVDLSLQLTGKEDVSNKVTSLSASSTNTQYPSAKCVYDMIGDIESVLDQIIAARNNS